MHVTVCMRMLVLTLVGFLSLTAACSDDRQVVSAGVEDGPAPDGGEPCTGPLATGSTDNDAVGRGCPAIFDGSAAQLPATCYGW